MSNIGHNSGDVSPFDQHKDNISELYDEAREWLDGDPITTQGQSEGVATLMDMLRKAKAAAEKDRKAEKQPHLDAGKAVDAKYKTITEKADLATTACKDALKPYLQERERQRLEDERRDREEAERLRKEAEAAAKSLDDMADAKDKLAQAVEIEKDANRTARKRENAKSQTGKAAHLRTVYRVNLSDLKAAASHYWGTEYGRQAISDALTKLAEQEVRGGKRQIPGFDIEKNEVVQ